MEITLNTLELLQNLKNFDTVMSAPNTLAATLYKKGSCLNNIKARCLAVLQVIVSLIAAPSALLVMIFAPAIFLFTHDKTIARLCASGCGAIAAAHLFRIPESLIGAIFPSILS